MKQLSDFDILEHAIHSGMNGRSSFCLGKKKMMGKICLSSGFGRGGRTSSENLHSEAFLPEPPGSHQPLCQEHPGLTGLPEAVMRVLFS